jgi:hypothetical protein
MECVNFEWYLKIMYAAEFNEETLNSIFKQNHRAYFLVA